MGRNIDANIQVCLSSLITVQGVKRFRANYSNSKEYVPFISWLRETRFTISVLTTRVQAQTTCSSNLLVQNRNNQSGLIQSSTSLNQQKKEYSSNMSCDWTLLGDAKLQLVFFGPFITQSNKDFVYVYDGNSSSARLIGGFSGSSRPGPIVSSSNQLYVRFISDGSSQYEGFKAIYRGIFIVHSGTRRAGLAFILLFVWRVVMNVRPQAGWLIKSVVC